MPESPKPSCPPHPSYDAQGFCVRCGFNGRTGAHPVVETSQADEAAKFVWAVAVLDAWAMKYEAMAPAPCFRWFTSRVDGSSCPRWVISDGLRAVGGHSAIFTTADAARIAAAELIIARDSSLAPPFVAGRASAKAEQAPGQPSNAELIATIDRNLDYSGWTEASAPRMALSDLARRLGVKP